MLFGLGGCGMGSRKSVNKEKGMKTYMIKVE